MNVVGFDLRHDFVEVTAGLFDHLRPIRELHDRIGLLFFGRPRQHEPLDTLAKSPLKNVRVGAKLLLVTVKQLR